MLGKYSHVAIVDNNVTVPAEFSFPARKIQRRHHWSLGRTPSPVFRSAVESGVLGETRERVRDCATIYRTDFSMRVGSIPEVETAWTWFLMQTEKTAVVNLTVIHNQNFSLRHSIKIRARAGKSRAELRYFTKTMLHGIFRVQRIVLLLLYYKLTDLGCA